MLHKHALCTCLSSKMAIWCIFGSFWFVFVFPFSPYEIIVIAVCFLPQSETATILFPLCLFVRPSVHRMRVCSCIWASEILLALHPEIFPMTTEAQFFTGLYKRFLLYTSFSCLILMYEKISIFIWAQQKTFLLLLMKITLCPSIVIVKTSRIRFHFGNTFSLSGKEKFSLSGKENHF